MYISAGHTEKSLCQIFRYQNPIFEAADTLRDPSKAQKRDESAEAARGETKAVSALTLDAGELIALDRNDRPRSYCRRAQQNRGCASQFRLPRSDSLCAILAMRRDFPALSGNPTQTSLLSDDPLRLQTDVGDPLKSVGTIGPRGPNNGNQQDWR